MAAFTSARSPPAGRRPAVPAASLGTPAPCRRAVGVHHPAHAVGEFSGPSGPQHSICSPPRPSSSKPSFAPMNTTTASGSETASLLLVDSRPQSATPVFQMPVPREGRARPRPRGSRSSRRARLMSSGIDGESPVTSSVPSSPAGAARRPSSAGSNDEVAPAYAATGAARAGLLEAAGVAHALVLEEGERVVGPVVERQSVRDEEAAGSPIMAMTLAHPIPGPSPRPRHGRGPSNSTSRITARNTTTSAWRSGEPAALQVGRTSGSMLVEVVGLRSQTGSR